MRCNSIALFFYFCLTKHKIYKPVKSGLWNFNNKLSNIIKSKYCILCVNNWKSWRKLLQNFGSRNFSFFKTFGKYSIFWGRVLKQKKQHFSFYGPFIINTFLKKNLEEKSLLNNLAKCLFVTSQWKPSQSQKNNVRAKAGWPVLFRYFADID